MIVSNLYEETIQLSKTLKNSENITKECYNLYRTLKRFGSKNLHFQEQISRKALKISGEIHEIKKDNQRIFSGLSKLISDREFFEYMNIEELKNVTTKANL